MAYRRRGMRIFLIIGSGLMFVLGQTFLMHDYNPGMPLTIFSRLFRKKQTDKRIKLHPDSLYRINISEELASAIDGNIYRGLKHFKNVCWKSQLQKTVNQSYHKNPFYLTHCTGSHKLDHCKEDFNFMIKHLSQKLYSKYGQEDKYRMRCLPYAYFAGVTKSGTSDLFDKMLEHPDVVAPSMKEPMYFNWNRMGARDDTINEESYGAQAFAVLRANIKLPVMNDHTRDPLPKIAGRISRPVTFSHYLDLFDRAAISLEKSQTKITIDGSPSYFWEYTKWQEIPVNRNRTDPLVTIPHSLYAVNPAAKIIIILRNPVTRFFSQFKSLMRLKKVLPSFDKFADEAVSAFESCNRNWTARECVHNDKLIDRKKAQAFGIMRPSLYSVYMRDYLSVFPREQLLVLKAEDYYKNRAITMDRITTFLNIAPFSSVLKKKLIKLPALNTRQKQKTVSERTMTKLMKFFQPFNNNLARMLDDESFYW